MDSKRQQGTRGRGLQPWAAIMVRDSHCVGLTFPGMMEDPGSFAGKISSPRPQRGPEPACMGEKAPMRREKKEEFENSKAHPAA